MSQPPPADGSANDSVDAPAHVLRNSSDADRQRIDAAAESQGASSPKVDNRRKFIRGSSLLIASALPAAGLAAATGMASATASPTRLSTGSDHSPDGGALTTAGPREIKLGVIGCGFRGTHVSGSLLASQSAQLRWHLTAVADAFPDRMQQALRGLKGRFPQQVAVDSHARCVGVDGFRQLLERDVEVVILATPPAFRPEHFEAAVASGKHVYAEKPIAVDIEGVRRFQAANRLAIERGLVVSVGWPRHQQAGFEATLEQLREGAIGRIVTAYAFQNVRPPAPLTNGKGHSPRDAQLRNWVHCNWTHHNWAGGGPWLEPQVHNLDTMNRLLGAHPLAARPAACAKFRGIAELQGFRNGTPASVDSGGHQPIEFLYAGGISLVSYCQLVDSAQRAKRVLTVHGTEGHCDLIEGKIFDSAGRLAWRASESAQQNTSECADQVAAASGCGQFDELIAALSDGGELNQAALAVEATLTAILGRTASSKAQRVEWAEVA